MSFLLGQQVIETKPKSLPVPTNQTWLALAPHVKRHFKTDMNEKDIAFELAYAHYKNSLKKKNRP